MIDRLNEAGAEDVFGLAPTEQWQNGDG